MRGVGGYNRLVALRNRYKNAYAQIDVQLKRRYDLIPNLVETAKGYLQHERGTLEAVVAARNAASAANARAAQAPGDTAVMKELSGAETALAGTLGRLWSEPALHSPTVLRPRTREGAATPWVPPPRAELT